MNAIHVGLAMAAPLFVLKGCSEQDFKEAVQSKGEYWSEWAPIWYECKKRVQEALQERAQGR